MILFIECQFDWLCPDEAFEPCGAQDEDRLFVRVADGLLNRLRSMCCFTRDVVATNGLAPAAERIRAADLSGQGGRRRL